MATKKISYFRQTKVGNTQNPKMYTETNLPRLVNSSGQMEQDVHLQGSDLA